MKAILITRFDNITVMMEKPDSEKLPTKKNIQDQLTRMIPYEALLAHVSALTGLDTPNIGDHMIHLRVPCSRCRPIGTLSRWSQTRGFYWVPARRMSCLMKMSMIRANPFTKIVGEIIAKKGRARPTNREIVVAARSTLGGRDNAAQHPCLFCSLENADAPFLGKPAAAADYWCINI